MDTLDVTGLPGSAVEYLEQLIARLRQYEKNGEGTAPAVRDDIELRFTTQPSKTLGPVTRRELYEDR